MKQSLNTKIKKYIKKLLYIFASSGFLIKYKLNKIKDNQLIILNLHRVSNEKNSSYSPLNLKIFENVVKFLIKNFEITTFSEIKYLSKKSKPLIILSFDDGYEDFYTNVLPISKKYDFKVNLNIIPNCIETKEPPINILFQDFLFQAPVKEILNISFGKQNFIKNHDLSIYGNEISRFIKNKSYVDQVEIAKEIKNKYFDNFEFKKTKIMSLEQLIQCSHYHEIGIHSYYHSNMYYETNEFFIDDTNKCINWVEKNLNLRPRIYAFPNNSYKDEHIEILKEMKFEHILLVNDKFSDIGNNVYNRFNFHADSFEEAKCKALGFKIK